MCKAMNIASDLLNLSTCDIDDIMSTVEGDETCSEKVYIKKQCTIEFLYIY